jgi:L-fucose mutarotase
MLKTRLLHPGILEALGEAGHGAQVLIADGNYPLGTRSNGAAHRVYLNLAPGLVSVTDVLRALVDAIPIEAAWVMTPDDGNDPAIFEDFRTLLGGIELERLGRFPFYDAARGPDVALAIATGEQRLYANLLLTIGVVSPD